MCWINQYITDELKNPIGQELGSAEYDIEKGLHGLTKLMALEWLRYGVNIREIPKRLRRLQILH